MVKRAAFLKTTALTIALMCTSMSSAIADVLNIRSDAPSTYVVKKGDTLWDISNIFLSKPWLWPELWRNNTQIANPHLIYPGDTLLLRYENGQAIIELVRDTQTDPTKTRLVLTPQSKVINKVNPISTLPWETISAFIKNDEMMEAAQYDALPTLLGDNLGTTRFIDSDYVLAHKIADTSISYQVLRKVREVTDSNGNLLGSQIRHISYANVNNALPNQRQVVYLSTSTIEAKQGDKLTPTKDTPQTDLTLQPATDQLGEIVQNINGNALSSIQDVVIVNIGKEEVSPGTVFGIYRQGPDVISSDTPRYSAAKSVLDVFYSGERVVQPAFKIGELVVIKSFDKASYAWITKADTHLNGGELIAKP